MDAEPGSPRSVRAVLHARTRDPFALRDALQAVRPALVADLGWPRGRFTSACLDAAGPRSAREVAAALSSAFGVLVLATVAEPGLLSAWVHVAGRAVHEVAVPPVPADHALPALLAALGEESAPPRTKTPPPQAAVDLAGRLAGQVRAEVAANGAWLRRHAALTGVELPAHELGRGEELALMTSALRALRQAEAGEPTTGEAGAGAARAAATAARSELREMQAAQRRTFHALVGGAAPALGIVDLPAPGDEARPYFATVEHHLASDPGRGALPVLPGEPSAAAFARGLAEALGLDAALLTCEGDVPPALLAVNRGDPAGPA